MKSVEHHRYWLPPPAWKPKGKPYLSRDLMDADQAAKRGALRPEPSTRQVIEVPETAAEMATRQSQGAGRDGAAPPQRKPN